MARSWPWFASLLLGCTTYSVQRAAMVPVVAPPLAPGDGIARTGISAGYLTPLPPPRLEPGSGAGLYLPRHTLGFEPRLALHRGLEVHSVVEAALAGDPMPLRQTDLDAPPAPGGWGGGVVLRTGSDGPGFATLATDLLLFSVSSRVRVTCEPDDDFLYFSDPCPEGGDTVERSLVPVARISGSVGFQGRRGYVYALAGIRNQPSNDGSDEHRTLDESRDPEVTAGAFYGLIGVGGALRLMDVLEITGQVWGPFGGGDIQYGPVFSLAISALLPASFRLAPTERVAEETPAPAAWPEQPVAPY